MLPEERQQIVEYQIVEYPADSLAAAGSAQEVEEAQLVERQQRGWVVAAREVPPWATRLKWCPQRLTPDRGPSKRPCAARRRRYLCRSPRRTL